MADGAWIVCEAGDGYQHVIPTNDLKPHDVGSACWCHPTDDEGLFVHHSMDRREDYEQGRAAS